MCLLYVFVHESQRQLGNGRTIRQAHKRQNKQTKNPEVEKDSRMTEKTIKNTNERKTRE